MADAAPKVPDRLSCVPVSTTNPNRPIGAHKYQIYAPIASIPKPYHSSEGMSLETVNLTKNYKQTRLVRILKEDFTWESNP